MPKVPGINDHVLFREVQRFRQKWIHLIILAIMAISWYSFYKQILLGEPFGTNPASDSVVWIIWVVFGIAFPLFIYSIKMVVEVKKDGLYIRFFPFLSRVIPFKDLKGYQVRDYKPIREYGGWGIRWSPWKGRAYNMSGNRGVQLELINGKRLLIGSQNPEKLVQAMDSQVKHDKSRHIT